MLEVEVKFAVEQPLGLLDSLKSWKSHGSRRDEDHYFSAPDRDFGITDEALRVRSIGDKNLVTYKGPKRDAQTKTRAEYEQDLLDGPKAAEQFRQLLTHLGYRPVGVVRKSRQVFASQRDGFALQATFDDVEHVGTYAEVEIVAEEKDYERAKALVLKVAEDLGMKQAERRSYLELLLARQRPTSEITTVRTVADVRGAIAAARHRQLSIGFVPTMGALHAGHSALIERARAECGFVVVSIFVNPTQFGPNEDFSRYPRTWDADLELCKKHGVDLVFAPTAEEVYPHGFGTLVEVAGLSDIFEGAIRPGHFRGVATVVLKLFNMVQTDVAYFGQKDAQQARVICQMVEDLNLPVRLCIVPTVREPDGLALSSRNRYLDPSLRPQATALSKALFAVRDAFTQGERDATTLVRLMHESLKAAPDLKLDYAEIVDTHRFFPMKQIDGPALAIIAARIGSTRLIDNLTLEG